MGAHYEKRLTATKVATIKEAGFYPDGGGLYLQVKPSGAKSWAFRYHVKGVGERKMGLGPLQTVGLGEAREKARRCRTMRLDNIDPIVARDADLEAKRSADAKRVTLEYCTNEWLKLRVKWAGSTRRRAIYEMRIWLPKLGKLPVDAINVDRIDEAIKEPWVKMHRSAKMGRQYLQRVLTWATAKGFRSGDNPARLDGPLGLLLPDIVYHAKRMDSLPWKEVGAFVVQQLRRKSPRTNERRFCTYILEFIILTGVRSHQAIELPWSEIDLDGRLWTCLRVKASYRSEKRPHKIPLSKPAMAILEFLKAQQEASGGLREHVFCHGVSITAQNVRSGYATMRRRQIIRHPEYADSPFRFGGKLLRSTALSMYLREINRLDIDVHGFRSSLKKWSLEAGYSDEVGEAALHHVVGNYVRNRYAEEAEQFELRRQMMERWGQVCTQVYQPPRSKVLPFQRVKAIGA